MAGYKLETNIDKGEWESFLLSNSPHTFLQSWYWGEVRQAMGSKIFRWGIEKRGKLEAVCLIIKEEARRGPYLLVPAGPVMNWDNEDIRSFFLDEIIKLARKENVWFIRLRPELEDSPLWTKRLRRWGFFPSPMHVHAENTWVLEIDKNDEELLTGMRKSTRYLVRKSLKLGFSLNISDDPQEASLLYKLQQKTAQRHSFVGFSEKLFFNEIKFFGKDNLAKVFVCNYKRKPLAAAIIVFYGNSAYYHYSGSVSEYNKLPFSYFLQWMIIQEAKKRKLKFYNFWGIAPNDDPSHRFAGVTLFKTGFGGKRVNWLHAQDFPLTPLYWVTFIFETLRHFYRRL
jgi:lipid II:glycine glycyltransferase (peptidoglycan interpeptide bridge formation enzyme)